MKKEVIKKGELEIFKLNLDTEFIYQDILSKASWRDDKIKIFGKEHSQPRKVAWYSEQEISYTYSGIRLTSSGIPPFLKEIKDKVEAACLHDFNSVLINYYRDGHDYMGWHSDDEKELGEKPVIASLSFGHARDFILRQKENHHNKIKLSLGDGELLIMKGSCQENWQHALPKRLRVSEGRINLTFRKILKSFQ